jgi:hypothetical protein
MVLHVPETPEARENARNIQGSSAYGRKIGVYLPSDGAHPTPHYPTLLSHFFCVLVRFCVVCSLQRLFSASAVRAIVSKCRQSTIKPGVIDALFVHHVMTDLWQMQVQCLVCMRVIDSTYLCVNGPGPWALLCFQLVETLICIC